MKFTDTAPIAGTRRTADSYLVAEIGTARTGIQDYACHEVGKSEMAIVKVYRSADQAFARESLGSCAHKPVTNDHPSEAADTWKAVSVGQIGDELARGGEFVRIPCGVPDHLRPHVADRRSSYRVQPTSNRLMAAFLCRP